MKFSRKNKIIMAIILVVILLIFILTKVTGKSTGTVETTYSTLMAEMGKIMNTVSGSGTLETSISYDVKGSSNGEIEDIHVSEGDNVEEGDLLVTLDDSSAQLSVDKMNITYQQALSEQQSIEDQLGNLAIKSNKTGLVVELATGIYQTVQKGGTIAKVVDDSSMYGKVYTDLLTNIEKFNLGETVIIYTQSGKTLSGKISTIDNKGENIQGTDYYTITLTINNTKGNLKTDSEEILTISNDTNTLTSLQSSEISYVNNPVSIVSMSSGQISKLNISQGDRISSGQTIVTIDGEELEDKLSNQKLTVKEALMNLNNAKESLEKLNIYATQSGTVTTINASPGDMAGESIMSITNYEDLNIIIPVDELDLDKITVGQEANITSEVYEGEIFKGTIVSIAREGLAQNGVSTFDVIITLEDKKNLKPGMTVNVDIIIEESENTIILPINAVMQDNQGYFVYKTSKTENITQEEMEQAKTYVEVGISDTAYTEITNGLEEGESIIYVREDDSNNSSIMGGFGQGNFGQGGERPTNNTPGERPSRNGGISGGN